MYAFGFIERKANGEELVKKLRLQRMQEVREQDRQLIAQRCSSYRDVIDDKKRAKRNALRSQKLASMRSQHDSLAKKWRKSLVDTGEAQRASKAAALEYQRHEVQEKEKQLRVHTLNTVRVKAATHVVHTVQEKRQATVQAKVQRRQLVSELQSSNREDARNAQEARLARIHAANATAVSAAAATGPRVILQAAAGQSSSSIRMQQSGPQAVSAAVLRHGDTCADITVVQNTAPAEEEMSYRKIFTMVVQEMKNRTRAKARARVAVRTTAMTKSQDNLDTELALLHTLDRSGKRISRIKTSSAVPANEEAPAVTQAFENAFLARQKVEQEAYDMVTNDTDSVASATTSSSADFSDAPAAGAAKKGVGFSEEADVQHSSGLAKAAHDTQHAGSAAGAGKPKKRVPDAPKVSFRSATNKNVQQRQRQRQPAQSSIPQQIHMPTRTYDDKPLADSAAVAAGTTGRSLEIGVTTAVSTANDAEAGYLTFATQAPPPLWSAAASAGWGAAADDDDHSSVLFENCSDVSASVDFSISSDSKLHFAEEESSAAKAEAEDVEITRRAMAPVPTFSRPTHQHHPNVLSAHYDGGAITGLSELVVSFSSEEDHSSMRTCRSKGGTAAYAPWEDGGSASDEEEDFDGSLDSDATSSARHDAAGLLEQEQEQDSVHSGVLSSTQSMDSAGYAAEFVAAADVNAFAEAEAGDEYEYYSDLATRPEPVDMCADDADTWNELFGSSAAFSVSSGHSLSASSSSSASGSEQEQSSVGSAADDSVEEEEQEEQALGLGSDRDSSDNSVQSDADTASLPEDVEVAEEVSVDATEQELEQSLSVSVRVQGAAAAGFGPADSVSFESLFVEDEEDCSSDEEEEARDSSVLRMPRLASSSSGAAPGSPEFTLDAFINKYADVSVSTATEEAVAVSPSRGGLHNPLRAPEVSLSLVQSDSALTRQYAEGTYELYRHRSRVVSSDDLRTSHQSAAASVGSGGLHSQSLRDLLGLDGSGILGINTDKAYRRGSFDYSSSGESSGSEATVPRRGTTARAVYDDCADIADELSDEDSVSADLVREIDDMKQRLFTAMHMQAAAHSGDGASASAAVPDDSLSQHTLSSSAINAAAAVGSSSGNSTESGASALSHHTLQLAEAEADMDMDGMSESRSKMSDNTNAVFHKLDVALGRALASSMEAGNNAGIAWDGDDSSEYDTTLSGGNLSSMGDNSC